MICLFLVLKRKLQKIVPEGTSEYQAAWIFDGGDESENKNRVFNFLLLLIFLANRISNFFFCRMNCKVMIGTYRILLWKMDCWIQSKIQEL